MKYTDKLGLPIWNKPETDVFDIEQFNEGMQAVDDIVIDLLNLIDDLVIGDKEIDLNGYVKEEVLKEYATATQLQTTNNNITNLTERITNLENSGGSGSGGSGGGTNFSGNAEDVTYNNPNYSELTSVDLALDKILDKLYYVKPSITSFNMSPSTTQYEKGQTVPSLSFTWSYNKNITSQSLSNCNITLSDRKATYSTPITSNKSFTLTCSDGENTASASKNITFFDKIYWGSKAEGTINSAFILSLTNNKFATAKAGTYSMTVATGEYGYIAMPTSFGVLSSVWIGGFEATVDDMGEIDFTNASGYTSKYKVYRTGKSGLGSISMQIK